MSDKRHLILKLKFLFIFFIAKLNCCTIVVLLITSRDVSVVDFACSEANTFDTPYSSYNLISDSSVVSERFSSTTPLLNTAAHRSH